ncbi:MAG TPA: GDSL-type esterase/lipase family protein, partial [Myxococcota bacterium]|nr:GDSL-type esterase/lipase family protein [Myxococcota bacterium]
MRAHSKAILFKLASIAIAPAIFALGFLGKPEDSAWLNASPLWQKGDPFYWEGTRALASPYFLFRGRPNATGKWHYYGVTNQFQHNELGLRDDAVTRPKPEGVLRILNLGDSATWGLSLPGRKHNYSDRLEEILNSTPRDAARVRYDVINGGTIGYTSWQARRWLEFYIAELEPDVVTLFIGNNDSAPGGMSDAQRGSPRLDSVTRVLGHNAFFLLLQKAWLSVASRKRDAQRELFLAAVGDRERPIAKEQWYASVARVAPSDYEANLRAIVEATRAHGARAILLKVPMNLVWPRTVTPTRRAIFDRELPSPLFVAPNYLVKGLTGKPPCDHPFLEHPWLCSISLEQLREQLLAGTRFADLDSYAADQQARLMGTDLDPLQAAATQHRLALIDLASGRPAEAAAGWQALVDRCARHPGCGLPTQLRAEVEHALGVALLLDGRRGEARSALVRSRELFP